VVTPVPIDLVDTSPFGNGDLIFLESGTQPYIDWIYPISEMEYAAKQHFLWAHWIMVF
jgi:hypothetical protein